MRIPSFQIGGKASYYKSTDFMTEAGARQIAAWIMQAWRTAGHPEVQAWVEREEHQRSVHVVKTNLMNGLPTRYTNMRS
jgi:hypothetical protein